MDFNNINILTKHANSLKKIALSLCILLITLSLSAQTRDESNQSKIQYYHGVEIQAGYGVMGYSVVNDNQRILFKNLWGVGVHELHGIQFNPHLSLAVELGMDFHKSYFDDRMSGHSGYAASSSDLYLLNFPLGLNFKYTILKRYNWSPFLMVSCLPARLQVRGFQDSNEGKTHSTVLLNAGSVCFSAGAQYRFNERQSIYAAIGYETAYSQITLTIGTRLH